MKTSKQLKKSKYITKITPLAKHGDLQEKYPDHHLATPVIKLRQVYPTTSPKDDEHVLYAKSRSSALAKSKRLARRIAGPNMGAHKDQPIEVIVIS